MSTYVLKQFQEKAKNRFKQILDDLEYQETLQALSSNPNDLTLYKEANEGRNDPFSIQIDAPTGSGKTVLLGFIVKEHLQDYVHIVFSPGAGDLEEQTAKRLASILNPTNVALVNETTFNQLATTGMTYIGNWEQFVSRDSKTGAYKNRVVREGDATNMFDWLSAIGKQFLPVAVTIDEAHYGSSKGLNSIKRFLEDIQNYLGYSPLYIEVSATHVLEAARKIKIDLQDVIKEGLIRKSVRLNGKDLLSQIDSLSPEQRVSYQIEPFLLDYALAKQTRLDAEYIKVDAHEMIDGKKIYHHALIGVQVPNGPLGNDAINRTENHLRDKYDITRENGKLAVFLSDDKTANMKDIDSPASAVQILIYKQGVATGWDCPRAQILVGFRHITSKIFTKQNLGRFVRTTQGKHYGNELLDYAYVISNVGDLGQASFGDDIDQDVIYEKESVYKIMEDGHIALSSFNDKKIEQNHFGFTNQTVVSPAALRKAWNKAADSVNLWTQLEYSYVSRPGEGVISGTATIESVNSGGNYILEGVSKKIAKNDAQQLKDFQTLISDSIISSGRTYGNNSQVARTLTTLIAKWYKEAVLKETSSINSHWGKLRGVITMVEAEKAEGLRYGEADWNDVAVEQLSLDDLHWQAINSTILTTLKEIKSVKILDENEFKTNGAPWAERTLLSDPDFTFNVNESRWISDSKENKVSPELAKYYATRMVGTDDSYREGTAETSGPEKEFEKSAISSLTRPSGNRLSSYYKSVENKTGSFRLGVATLDEIKVSNFYPDYLGELVNDDEEYSPWIIEVKSLEDVQEANGDSSSILTAKAKRLVDLAKEYNIKAGIAYGNKEKEWFVITGVSEVGKFKSSSFKEYMLS